MAADRWWNQGDPVPRHELKEQNNNETSEDDALFLLHGYPRLSRVCAVFSQSARAQWLLRFVVRVLHLGYLQER